MKKQKMIKGHAAKINDNCKMSFARHPDDDKLRVMIKTFDKDEIVLFEETFRRIVSTYLQYKRDYDFLADRIIE